MYIENGGVLERGRIKRGLKRNREGTYFYSRVYISTRGYNREGTYFKFYMTNGGVSERALNRKRANRPSTVRML